MLGKFLREHGRGRTVRALLSGGDITDAGLDRFTDQAARAFAAPIAVLSLIEDGQQWIAASHGIALTCTPRGDSFCTHALDRGPLLEVCDPCGDPRFRDLPCVTGDLAIRYYIGATLRVSDGADVGALCVLDTRPRAPASADQRAYLLALARQVSMTLEQRLAAFGRLAA